MSQSASLCVCVCVCLQIKLKIVPLNKFIAKPTPTAPECVQLNK